MAKVTDDISDVGFNVRPTASIPHAGAPRATRRLAVVNAGNRRFLLTDNGLITRKSAVVEQRQHHFYTVAMGNAQEEIYALEKPVTVILPDGKR